MSSNIYEDLNLTENVRYCKGARGDGGVKVERVVDIYESAGTVNDQHVDRSTQDLGAHTQKRLSIVQRNSFRAAALILGLLLVVAVVVLSKLYISASSAKHRHINRYEKLHTAYEELKKGLCGNNSEGWKGFGCSCYHKSTEMKNWTESRKACQDRGADLVTINNKEEQNFLLELDEHGDFWVGLQSVRNPTSWKHEWEWVDKSRPGYEAWNVKVNVNPLEGAAGYIDLEETLQHSNNGSKQWICEKQM
ncbi:CD209 antigen-like protein D [Larimichthys crocea]|uniref:CD209 antigen-like protein D n=1 Tax=Larimichthys crocea TaxID=215358 RepID=UPI000F5E9E95|nr:CD209 antigen-like protein D [Larimichthys crocea]